MFRNKGKPKNPKDVQKDDETEKQRPSARFFQRIFKAFSSILSLRIFVCLLVIVSILLFFMFIMGTTIVCFVLVMLENFIKNQNSTIPRQCYEGLSIKERLKILTLVSCKDKFNEKNAKELGLDNDNALMCIYAFNDALNFKIKDYDDKIDQVVKSLNVQFDLITKNILEELEKLKKHEFFAIFTPLFQITQVCVKIIDEVFKLMNTIVETVYQVFIALFMSLIYGKNISAIIFYVIAGIIIFIMIIMISIFFALLPVPFFKIPAMIYLAVIIGPLLIGKLVVTILKALSRLMLLKKAEEMRMCEEYSTRNECVYNASFKYCKWYENPTEQGKGSCYSPDITQPCQKFKNPSECNQVTRCEWERDDCRYNVNFGDDVSPSRRSGKRSAPETAPGSSDPFTSINDRILEDQKFEDDQEIPDIP